MKKLALVLAVLLVVGGAAFAEVVVGGEATVSGSVSTTLGMDLESNVWGMDADSSISVVVPIANGADGASGDDDMYGEINLTGVALNFDDIVTPVDSAGDDVDGVLAWGDNDLGDIAARIVVGDFYVGLNWGGYNNNYAEGTEDFDVNLDGDWYAVPAFGDLAFGYDSGMLAVELEVATKNGIERAAAAATQAEVPFADAWTGYTAEDIADADAGTQTGVNGLVFSADLTYTSEMITVPVYVTLDPDWGGALLLGVSTDIAVAAGALSVALPADFVMLGSDSGFDVAPVVTYAVSDAISVGADAYYYNHGTDSLLNAGVDVMTAFGALTADLGVDLDDVTGTLGYGVDLGLGYTVADGFSVAVDSAYDGTDFELSGGLVFGAAFTGIDNTEITVDYTDAVLAGATDKGIVSCTATVSF